MTAITRYPVDPEHDPLYRGDPVSIGVRVSDNTGTAEAPVYVPRPLTGTYWRAHVRVTEDGPLLTRFTVVLAEDLPGAGPDAVGWLYLTLTDVESRQLRNACVWDLEQISNAADDETTHSLGTYWKVRSASVVKDVSHA